MVAMDPLVERQRRFAAALPSALRYRYLRWRQKRPGARSEAPRIAARRDGLLMEVDEADVIDFAIRHFGVWEPALAALIGAHLRAGDIAVDIGANIGAHTLAMARAVGASGAVVAVEPGPDTAARLRRNIALNDLAQVRVVEAAAADSAGTAPLYAGPDGTRGRATMDAEVAGAGAPTAIATMVAADLLTPAEWARTRLIKIDVERAEDRVLRGLAPALALLPRDALLIVETEPQLLLRRGAPLRELVRPLPERGAIFHALVQHVDLRSMLRPLRFELEVVDPDLVRRTSHTDFVIGAPETVAAAVSQMA
jgi:FkbM family methyltransferase